MTTRENISDLISGLLRASLFGGEISISRDAGWRAVYEEMKLQTVAGLPFYFLCGLRENPEKDGNPRDSEPDGGRHQASESGVEGLYEGGLYYEWIAFCMRQTGKFDFLLEEQDRLLQLLADNGIPAAVLKGCAAAVSYPQPQLRAMGDIDFLVRERDYQRAGQIMRDSGYVVTHEEQKGGCHTRFVKNGAAFELHRKPNGIVSDDGKMVEWMAEGLKHIEMHQIRGYSVPVLPEPQNGMVLMLHIVKHLRSSGLGLRQVIDWMMYANRYLSDGAFPELEGMLRESGLWSFAAIVTKLCQMYLGLRRDITWCAEADENVCGELWNYLLEQGNFGRKKPVDTGAKILASKKNIFDFLSFLQRTGCINWKATQKYPVLRMFAWAYQALKYVRIVLGQEKPADYLKYSLSESERKRDFYGRLGIREWNV